MHELIALYPTTFRWNMSSSSVPSTCSHLYIPLRSDETGTLGISSCQSIRLYIPLRSDETFWSWRHTASWRIFISHYVQMKPFRKCSTETVGMALYPTTFRWNGMGRQGTCVGDGNFISHYVQMKPAMALHDGLVACAFISHYVQMKRSMRLFSSTFSYLYIPLRSDETDEGSA